MMYKKIIDKPFSFLILIVLGLAVILGTNIIHTIPLQDDEFNFWQFIGQQDVVLALSEAIGVALVVSGLISYYFDTPRLRKYFKSRITEVITGHQYLNDLPLESLKEIRDKTIRIITERDARFVSNRLLDIDTKMTELLTSPYYGFFRTNIHCEPYNASEKAKGGPYTKKTVSTSYKVINPLLTEQEFEYKGILEFDKKELPDGVKSFQLGKFNVIVDNKKEENLTSEINVECEEIKYKSDNETAMGYKYRVFLRGKDGKALKWKYKKTLIVEVEDVRYVPKSDDLYMARFNYPLKDLNLVYTIEEENTRLVGSCFTTMSDSAMHDVSIVSNQKSISIVANTWLLPGNGVFVAEIRGE